MNKIYDKLLLAIALLALVGSLAFYFMNAAAEPAKPGGGIELAEHPYQPIAVKTAANSNVNWPEPEEQSTGWVYDVFTPPKIYLDENGRFVNEGWKIFEEVPFGVYLAALERKLFRIQLEGYIEEDTSDSSKSLLLLYDEELKRSVRARVGDLRERSEFKVLDFKIDRLRDENGNPYKEVYATILDQRSGESVILKNDERLYEKGVTIKFRSKQDPEVDVVVDSVGTEFETTQGRYLVEEINLEEMVVTVKKLATEDREAEVQRLAPQAKTPEVKTPAPASALEESSMNPLEGLF